MNKNQQYLDAMGVQVWQERDKEEQVAKEVIPELSAEVSVGWDDVKARVLACKQCELHETRTNVVFGVGNQQADLLVIGEAPGANEDKQGEPFVGRAGKLLDSMLHAIDLDRKDIYIANILKCRPPSNRDPQPNEVKLCSPFLKQQIALLKPKLIVTVGRIAAHFLLDTTEPMGKLRGQVFEYESIPVLATYHPAYLLRSPREKAKAYQDVLRIAELINKV